jgi:hypothetical protein
MKNLLLLFFLLIVAVCSAQSPCDAPNIKQKNVKAQSTELCYITFADPGNVQWNYDIHWRAAGSSANFRDVECLSGFHYDVEHPEKSTTTLGIATTSDPQWQFINPFYGIKDGDEFYITKHCLPQDGLTNCYNDTYISLPTEILTVKFRGH